MFKRILLIAALVVVAAMPALGEAGVNSSIVNSLGPLNGALGTPTSTIPMVGQGIANDATLTTSAKKVVSASGTTTPSQRVTRFKLVCVTAGRTCSYTTVVKGTAAPTLTAVGDGTATDGSLLFSQQPEFVSFPDNVDIYMAASAASTVYQVTRVDGTFQ